MKLVSDPGEVWAAWTQQYERLSRRFATLLRSKTALLVEIGCGKGQLTIPLAILKRNHSIIAVDRFEGPYSADYEDFISTLSRRGLKRRIRIVVSDCFDWQGLQPDNKYDGVISSEFLPEIDSDELNDFLSECWRILKPGGVTIHSFLSPADRTRRQRLLIEADSNPKWTKDPPKEWFSPPPKLVLEQLRQTGFVKVTTSRLKSDLAFKANAARILLKTWGVRGAFWDNYREQLLGRGLEIPDWVIVVGFKP